MKVQLNSLNLVYPPISNQEAEWLKGDQEVVARVSTSNLYMICRRREAQFTNLRQIGERSIGFEYSMEGMEPDPVELHFVSIPEHAFVVPESIEIEAGAKYIRVWELADDGASRTKVFCWFTTESILYKRARGYAAIHGLERYREFSSYELLYVGISKEGDAFSRLVLNAHEKRVSILSNEDPLRAGARVTDEVFFMFFRIDPLHIRIVEDATELAELAELAEPKTLENALVIADAEKAFTSVLKSRYNKVRFKNYPRGSDGLYGSGLLRHAYVINEDITLSTADARIRGARDHSLPVSNDADSIWIEGDSVELLTADDLRRLSSQSAARPPT